MSLASKAKKEVKRSKPVEPVKTGFIFVARVGLPAEPSVLAVLATRYEALGKTMELTRCAIQRVETVPGGRLGELLDRLSAGQDAARTVPHRAGVHIMVDVSRSPEARHMAMERLPEAQMVLLVPGIRADWDVPYRLLGRLSVLSGMATLLARQQLAVAIGDSDDPRRMSRAQVREVLGKAQVRPPRLEEEELALGSSADDDAALCIALAAWHAWESTPTPWKES